MEERGKWREISPQVLKDCFHAVNLYLLDGLLEPPGEFPYGFILLLYNSLQRTNIPLMSYRTKILRDEYSPKLVERIYRIKRELMELG